MMWFQNGISLLSKGALLSLCLPALILTSPLSAYAAEEVKEKSEDVRYVRKMHYPNGNLRGEVEYIRGFPHGSKKTYYETGEVKNVEGFKLGWLHGPFIRYYKNGNIRSTGVWVHGRPDGLVTVNHPNGMPFLKCLFDEGTQKKPCEGFTDKGEAAGKIVKSYYKSGTLAVHGEFKDGIPHGTVRYFTEDEILRFSAPYVDGKIHGFVKGYDWNTGHLASETEFREGKNEGLVYAYYPNGVKQSKAQYENWLLEGEVSYYDKKGDVLGTYKYKSGYLVEHLYIREDAQRKEKYLGQKITGSQKTPTKLALASR